MPFKKNKTKKRGGHVFIYDVLSGPDDYGVCMYQEHTLDCAPQSMHHMGIFPERIARSIARRFTYGMSNKDIINVLDKTYPSYNHVVMPLLKLNDYNDTDRQYDPRYGYLNPDYLYADNQMILSLLHYILPYPNMIVLARIARRKDEAGGEGLGEGEYTNGHALCIMKDENGVLHIIDPQPPYENREIYSARDLVEYMIDNDAWEFDLYVQEELADGWEELENAYENVSPPYSYENNIYNKYQAVKLHGNNLNSYGSNNEYYTSNNNGDNMNTGGNWRNNQQYASAGLQRPQNWGNYQAPGQGWGYVAPGAGGGKSNWRNNSWRNYQGQYNYQGQSNYQGKYNYQGAEYHEQENSGEESNNNDFKGTTYEQFVARYVPEGGTSLLNKKWEEFQKLQTQKPIRSSGGTKKKYFKKKSTRRK